MPMKMIDLTDTVTEGGVYVKCLVPSSGGAGKHKKWVCVCPECGREFITQSNHLIGNKISSCVNCARTKRIDIIGQTFYYLTVIERADDSEYSGSTYLCKCKCGNYHIASSSHLRSGSVRSCGCLKSSYEQKIKRILTRNHIQFVEQKTFKECPKENRNPLRFDFYIPELNMLLEMQGEQHFRPVKFWGGDKGFAKRQHYDKLKEEFCDQYGYRLLKIYYNEDIEQRVNEEIVWPLRK